MSSRDIAQRIGGISHVTVAAHLRKGDVSLASAPPSTAAPSAGPDQPGSLIDRLIDLASCLHTAGMSESNLVWEAVGQLRAIDAALDAGPSEPVVEVPTDLSSEGVLKIVRTLIQENRVEHANWAAIGHSSATTRTARTIAMLLPILARLERQASDESGICKIPRGDIAGALVSAHERAATLLRLGVRCGKCYSELQVALAEGQDWDDGPPGPAACCKCGGLIGSELGSVLVVATDAYARRQQ